jgi:hypothetical protein
MEFENWLQQSQQVCKEMKRIVAALVTMIATTAAAECYQRTDINIGRQRINTVPTDIQRLVTPDARGYKCVARYRLHIGDHWVTVEGSAVARTETSACEQALDIKAASALEEVPPNSVRADQQLVCSDLPDIRVRSVRRGELIRESEVDLHSHPLERAEPYFVLKQARCRKFIERVSKNQNLIIYQGIICQATTANDSRWLVLDKY